MRLRRSGMGIGNFQIGIVERGAATVTSQAML